MTSRQILLFTSLLFVANISCGQFYDTGQDPSSLKWMQIKTGRFTVIYPKTYGSQGISFAHSLDEAYSKLLSLYPEKKFRIPVIIHNFTTESNGYVAWAPRRMEIYPTPEQNTIPLDPEKQLAIHELTHVLQMESLYRGFSKGMSFIFGEQFTGVVAFLLPMWFLEGDAVFAESVLTESGRGRSPSFQKELKAMAVDNGGVYKYDKILNGSYRDFVPDYYQTGYQIVTWALSKYNPQIWNDVLRNAADQPFTINPVNISLKRSAGMTKKKLSNETFDTLKTIWTKDVTDSHSLSYEIINPAKKGKYISYNSPVYAGIDSIIAIRTSLSLPPEFVMINPSKKSEEKILTPGQIYPLFISYARGKIVWVETVPDPRWENRNYSVIKLMDLQTGEIRKLSRKSRYLSASVSPDGTFISAVENTVNNVNNLVIIDTKTGSVITSVPAPGNIYLQRPQWSEKGDKITLISLTESGEGILSYSIAGRKWETLLEPARDDLQSTFLKNDSLFFISSHSGTDNIFLKTNDNRVKEFSRSRFGATDLSINNNKIFFSNYTSLGNNISIVSASDSSGISKENISTQSFLINRFEIEQKTKDDHVNTVYTPEPYRKWQHLFKFHSWMPFYADIEEIKADPTTIRPGVSFMTQNSLSTLISTIGYEYSAENKNVVHSKISWKGWYPVVESEIAYGNDPRIFTISNVSSPAEIKPGIRFINTISLPLSFSSGRFSEFLQPSITSDYRNDYIYLKEAGSYDYGQTIYSGRLYFSNFHRTVLRDIYPKWAQIFDLNYSYAPFDRNIYGTSISLKTAFYFPGFLPNNGIKIRYEKEKQDPSKFLFSNRVLLPRGYENISSKEIALLSIDYVMPLVYPDFNIASLLYLKRIRTGLFYDYASGPGNSFYQPTATGLAPLYNNSDKVSFRSFGIDLLADFHIFRIPFMISSGVQTAWKSLGEMPSFELLFNMDLYGMTIGRRPN